jgi:hypothetical protein
MTGPMAAIFTFRTLCMRTIREKPALDRSTSTNCPKSSCALFTMPRGNCVGSEY